MDRAPEKAYAAWSDESMTTADGQRYQVAVCEADEPGYWKLSGEWPTLEAAKQEAARLNTEVWGHSLDAVLDIRSTSMAAQQRGWNATDYKLLGDEPR